MDNGTSSDSNSSTTAQTTLTTSSSTISASPTGTETETDTDSGGGGGGLSSSAKGGIAGGIVGAVALTSIIFLLLFFLRRKKQRGRDGEIVEEDKAAGGDEGRGTATANEEHGNHPGEGAEGEPETEAAMLASRMKLELDGASREVHEMDSPVTPATATALSEGEQAQMEQMKSRRFAELPGSLEAVAEMSAENEARSGHGQRRQE
ncbi:hypothetical protein BDW69DRAFT_183217 [Aspergillus filifer]